MTSPGSLMTSPPRLTTNPQSLMASLGHLRVQQNDLLQKHHIPRRQVDRVTSVCPEPCLYRRHVQDLIPLRQTCSPVDAMTHVYFGKSYPDSSPEIGAPTSILEESLWIVPVARQGFPTISNRSPSSSNIIQHFPIVQK